MGTAIAVAGGLLGIATFYLGWSSFWNPLLGHYGTVPGGYYPRLTSLFSSPNTLCNYLIVGAALVWYRGSRLFLAGILSVSLFTVSSGLGGLALVMGLSARRIRGAAGLGIILAAVSLAAVLVSPTALMEGSLEPSGRLLTWREALDDWADHPLTGAGPGATTIEVHYQGPAGAMMHWTEAHNIWLSVASQLGLLGLVPLLGLTVWSLRPAVSQMQHLRKALQMALLGSWLIHGLSGAFEDSRHLWVLLGMLAATECDE